jgi:hypothetical protein
MGLNRVCMLFLLLGNHVHGVGIALELVGENIVKFG